MLLTITAIHTPQSTIQSASDITFLLHKNPDKLHTLSLSFGKVHIFFTECMQKSCTAVLLLDIDTVGLVRKDKGNNDFALAQYVNDRPYVASSFMSVALNKAFRTLLSGRSKHRPELVNADISLEVTISLLPCDDGVVMLERLFNPLGYEIIAEQHKLNISFSDCKYSKYYTVTLKRTCPLREFLSHLYVLIPVLDNDKHYYISDDEVNKLLRFGDGWLGQHPEYEMIVTRYLKFRSISNAALNKLAEAQKSVRIIESGITGCDRLIERSETKESLREQRIQRVVATLKSCKAKRILDLGCGEGKLLEVLLHDKYFDDIVGCDVSIQALEKVHAKLHLETLPALIRQRIKLIQTALTYKDKRLLGYDAAAIIEVIEHLDLPKLHVFRRVVFGFIRPNIVIITTPNVEYNALITNLPADSLRHHDHRFEWTRQEFTEWAQEAARDFGYHVTFENIGEAHYQYGAPTQMGIFVQRDKVK